jgi:hypothetical protein
MPTAVAERSFLALPPSFVDEAALTTADEMLDSASDIVIDARRTRDVDAVGAATLGLYREHARVVGAKFALIAPAAGYACATLDEFLRGHRRCDASDARRQVIVPATTIGDRRELREVADRVGDVLATGFGRTAHVARIAVSTLTDNALRHGGGPESPVVAVGVTDRTVEVCVRDRGIEFEACADLRQELVRRIQLPAEATEAEPGSPIGIAWLAALIQSRDLDGRLTFAAGNGRLSFRDRRWCCHRADASPGFAAIAQLPADDSRANGSGA